MSPDNNHLYVAALDDHAAAVFNRNSSAGEELTIEVIKDGINGVEGLYRVDSVTLGPDTS